MHTRRAGVVFRGKPREGERMKLDIRPQPAPCGALVHGLDLSRELAARRGGRDPRRLAATPGAGLPRSGPVARRAGALRRHHRPLRRGPVFRQRRRPSAHRAGPARRRRNDQASSPRPGIRTGASCRCRRKPPCSTATSSRPIGGDTLFANQYAAWDALPAHLQALLRDKQGIHSARRGYARDGMYGEKDKGRSMAIRFDDSALATQPQPDRPRASRDRPHRAVRQPRLHHRHRRH